MQSLLEIVLSPDAPAPIGPYSQAVRTRDFLFCSGQIALDPATGEMKNGSIEEETRQVMKNLRRVLVASGATFANVAKTTIFLTNMDDFAVVNKVYDELLGTSRPARSTVQVAALPKGARVEIECVAALR
ncbi:MAG: RidA family protein [Bacteroidota bacterium]|nr:RidA family protein [Bacteroidota bacterium]MDP4233368.1 RidA family protein [Bacteroidota bacterium]MDP4242234.1 RidA family protein [Bacteroidota bacterium]MDP4286990.1 RidA family protein [Bacteroidota bacterium]